MREIVRMTAQKQPLEVGVPLYPFSHTTLFNKDEAAQASSDEGSSGAPLPAGSPYEDQGLSPPSTAHSNISNGRSGPNSGWPLHDTSVSPGGGNLDIMTGGSGFIG